MVFIIQQIKFLFLSILGIFRRALCCLSRQRRKTNTDDDEAVQVIVDTNSNYSRTKQSLERDWNSWDDSPRTVEEHIEQYRQRMVKPPTPQNEELEPDFFSDLTPKIQPQPKYYLGGAESKEQTDFSRLEAKTDVPIAINADLEDWMDEEQEMGGWETLDTELSKQVIREKRREMRNERQKSMRSTKGIDMQSPRHETSGITGATRIGAAAHSNQT